MFLKHRGATIKVAEKYPFKPDQASTCARRVLFQSNKTIQALLPYKFSYKEHS